MVPFADKAPVVSGCFQTAQFSAEDWDLGAPCWHSGTPGVPNTPTSAQPHVLPMGKYGCKSGADGGSWKDAPLACGEYGVCGGDFLGEI